MNSFSYSQILKDSWEKTRKNIGFLSLSFFIFILSIIFLPSILRIFISVLGTLINIHPYKALPYLTYVSIVLVVILYIQGLIINSLLLTKNEKASLKLFIPKLGTFLKTTLILSIILILILPFILIHLSFIAPILLKNFGIGQGVFANPLTIIQFALTMFVGTIFFILLSFLDRGTGYTTKLLGDFALFLMTGLIVVVIPAIIIVSRLIFSLFFLLDKNMSITDSIKQSLILTREYSLKLFLLFLICFLVTLPISGLGITLFIIIPFIFVALAIIYKKITNEKDITVGALVE